MPTPTTLPLISAHAILNALDEGLWLIDAGGITTVASARMAEMLGYQREEMLGRPLFDFMNEEGRTLAVAGMRRREEGLAEPHDFLFRRKNGEALPVRMRTGPIHGPSGEYAGAFALVTDLTEARRLEHEHDRFWRILDESLHEIYIIRGEGLRFDYASRAAIMNLGYTLAELRTMTPMDIAPHHAGDTIRALLSPLSAGTEKVVFSGVHRRRDGTIYPTEVRVHRTASVAPEYVAIVEDTTARVVAENALRATEARNRAVIENSTDLLFLSGADGRFTFASPSATRVLGYTPEELIGIAPLELIHPDEQGMAEAAFRNLGSAEDATNITFRARHKDGSWRTLSATAKNLLANPDVAALVLTARDVTNERRLEEHLQQSQRLESVGRLAGGVAHDFNNILTTILGCTTFLLEDSSLSESAIRDVQEIKEASERAGDLTNQLLAFARRRVIRPRTVAIGEVMASQERLLRRVLGEQIVLTTEVARDLWSVQLDPAQLEQIIVNLAVNARDAMKDGGRLVFEARNVVLDAHFVNDHDDISPGPHVLLVVSDSGHGIPAEILPHIFEPFFTTKAVGQGSGLGLASVYGIVRQSHGHIWVYSEPGIGTTFKIYFPRSDAPAMEAEPIGRPSGTDGSERILIVEDEESVRRTLVRSLEGAGYSVHAEATPAGALVWARANGGAFDLLLTDVVMPGMSGSKLAEQLTSEFPQVRVLFVSGYTENTIVHRGVLDERVAFLGKPFSLADLRAAVRGVLDREPHDASGSAIER